MTPSDDLFEVWQSHPKGPVIDRNEILRQIDKRTRSFDRTIRFRDLRESGAGMMVAAIFLWFAIRGGGLLQRASFIWLSACGVWIIAYMRRYSRVSRKPSPDQSLAEFRQALLDRYDNQIQLLRTVKYWYLLPFWLGLMASNMAHLIDGGSKTASLVSAAIFTLVFAAIWWLNEGPGVRYIQRQREELMALYSEDVSR